MKTAPLVAAAGLVLAASIAIVLRAQTPSTRMHEGFVPVAGAKIFYIDSGGAGTPVVFLHAATGSSRVWERQIQAFTAAGYRVIAYDRRGWGRSTIDPAGPQPGTGADDLRGLLEALKIDRFHLAGTAAGAIVAIDYGLSFPRGLKSLVLANTIGGVEDEDYLSLSRRIRPSPQFDALPPEFKELGPAYRAANPEGTERWLEFERTSRPAGPRAPAQPMRNKITFALLKTIGAPTLLIAGGADLYAPPPVMRLFANAIGHSSMVSIPDSGHSTYWEAPEQFNSAVLRFIRQH